MSKYITTLNAIRKHQPCKEGWEQLLEYLGKIKADDEPLDLLTILDSNGLDDALWCLRALPEEHHPMIHALACDFAEKALRFAPRDEPCLAAAIAAKRAWLKGEITDAELAAARDAAWNIVCDAMAAKQNAMAAAAWAARAAARVDAEDAVCDARSSSNDAAWFAAAARAAATVWHAELEWQTQHFRKILTGEAGNNQPSL